MANARGAGCWLAAFAAVLAIALPGYAAEARRALAVTATVVAACQFEVDVPKVGTPERSTGTAKFSLRCTRGALATATPDPASAARDPNARRLELGSHRVDYELGRDGLEAAASSASAVRQALPGIGVETVGGTTVATILF